MLFLWIKTFSDSIVIFAFKTFKMSLSKALCGMLALMPTNQVLAEDIWLEVVVQDG